MMSIRLLEKKDLSAIAHMMCDHFESAAPPSEAYDQYRAEWEQILEKGAGFGFFKGSLLSSFIAAQPKDVQFKFRIDAPYVEFKHLLIPNAQEFDLHDSTKLITAAFDHSCRGQNGLSAIVNLEELSVTAHDIYTDMGFQPSLLIPAYSKREDDEYEYLYRPRAA